MILLLAALSFAVDPETPAVLAADTPVTVNGRRVSLDTKHWLVTQEELELCLADSILMEKAEEALYICRDKKDEILLTCMTQITKEEDALLIAREALISGTNARHKCEAQNSILVDNNKRLRKQRNGAYAVIGSAGTAAVVAVVLALVLGGA